MDDVVWRSQIVSIARRWIGTKYCHQASLEGAGADCLGLFRGVWRELFGQEPVDLPIYSSDWNVADGDRLRKGAAQILKPIAIRDQRLGDIVLFKMRDKGPAKHLGILACDADQCPTFIHSYSLYGVVESALTSAWSRRIDGCFAIPERTS